MAVSVSIRNLSKKFNEFHAVKGISFTVSQGEVLGFLGPNGAGKTTTMRMITGYLPPSAGNVEVCGIDALENPIEAQKRLGYLPEGGPLYNDMTPNSFLRFIGEVRGLSEVKLNERIDYVVEKLYINDVFYQPIETLSKGYKRRVALAQAILHDPDVLILDEPTDGLDPNQKFEVRALISAMAKDKAIIISTHILEEVDAICTRAVVISDGEIVGSGTPAELAAKAYGHNSVVIHLKDAPADKVLNDILQVKGVDKVNVEGQNTVVAVPKNGQLILPEVAEAVRKKNVAIEEMYAKTGALDDAFRSLTKGAKAN
ncbi:MAG: transporter ATP-binding protein [Rickettsiaceae bacterium]|jgi:ABC-2 type transport system ATP-binding protein|nr:transporter ATP-binding protein [Rickettsiaceae bacterium]